MHSKKSSAHDQLSLRFIKQINDAVVNLISLIVNRSLSEGIVPSAMKLIKVIPIYKSKDNEYFSNYHPLSLLPSVSEFVEKVVHKRVCQFKDYDDYMWSPSEFSTGSIIVHHLYK